MLYLRLRGCPTTLWMAVFVILSEAKNLMDSSTYTSEILRLTPQNDVVGQPLTPDFSPEVQIYLENAVAR